MSSTQQSPNSSDVHNGGCTDKYVWSQTLNDLDIKVPVRPEVRKGKDVQVVIKAESLEVRLTSPADSVVLVSGKLSHPISREDSYWNLEPGKTVNVWLQKSKGRWWTGLLEGEEPIDPKSIESVLPMSDLQDEEQMKLHELMWNQEQKLKGLPTSQDQKLEKILRKAWNAEGSPFKGQPYDPSLVKLGSDDMSGIPIPETEEEP